MVWPCTIERKINQWLKLKPSSFEDTASDELENDIDSYYENTFDEGKKDFDPAVFVLIGGGMGVNGENLSLI